MVYFIIIVNGVMVINCKNNEYGKHVYNIVVSLYNRTQRVSVIRPYSTPNSYYIYVIMDKANVNYLIENSIWV